MEDRDQDLRERRIDLGLFTWGKFRSLRLVDWLGLEYAINYFFLLTNQKLNQNCMELNKRFCQLQNIYLVKI